MSRKVPTLCWSYTWFRGRPWRVGRASRLGQIQYDNGAVQIRIHCPHSGRHSSYWSSGRRASSRPLWPYVILSCLLTSSDTLDLGGNDFYEWYVWLVHCFDLRLMVVGSLVLVWSTLPVLFATPTSRKLWNNSKTTSWRLFAKSWAWNRARNYWILGELSLLEHVQFRSTTFP